MRAPWCLGLSLALLGCAPAATGVKAKAKPRGSEAPGAQASAMPLLPSSQAMAGRVLLPSGQPAVGLVVKATRITDNGAGYLGANGLIGDHGGQLITNNGAGLLGPQAAFRLAQAPLAATTDAQGRFALALPSGGAFNLEAASSDASLKAIAQGATAASGAVQLSLDTPGRLEVQVGTSLEGVSDFTGVDVFLPGTAYTGKADASGRVRFDSLPAGSFPLIATSPKLGQGLLTGVVVRPGQSQTEPRKLMLERQVARLSQVEPKVWAPGLPVRILGSGFGKSKGSVVEVLLDGKALSSPKVESDGLITLTLGDTPSRGDLVVKVDGIQGLPLPVPVVDNLVLEVPEEVAQGQALPLRCYGLAGPQEQRIPLTPTLAIASGSALELGASGTVRAIARGVATLQASLGALKVQASVEVRVPGALGANPGRAHALAEGLSQLAFDPASQRLVLGCVDRIVTYPVAGGEPQVLAGPGAGGVSKGLRDGLGGEAGFGYLASLVWGPAGQGGVALESSALLRRIGSGGRVELLAGDPLAESTAFRLGQGNAARLGSALEGLAWWGSDRLLFTSQDEAGAIRLLAVDAQGQLAQGPAWPEATSWVDAALGPDGSAWLLTSSQLVRVQPSGAVSVEGTDASLGWDDLFVGGGGGVAVDAQGAVWVLGAQGQLLHRPAGASAWQGLVPRRLAGDGGRATDGPLAMGEAGWVASAKGLELDAQGRLWFLDGDRLRCIPDPLASTPVVQTVLRPELPMNEHRAK